MIGKNGGEKKEKKEIEREEWDQMSYIPSSLPCYSSPLRGLGPGPSAATKGEEEDAEREKRVISRLGPHVDLAHCLFLPSSSSPLFLFLPRPMGLGAGSHRDSGAAEVYTRECLESPGLFGVGICHE